MEQKPFIYDATTADLTAFCRANDVPLYRVKQVEAWLARGINSPDDLTDISKSLREKLASEFNFAGLVAERNIKSQLDATEKFVFRLADGQCVESVFMQYRTGNSVCLSTQAGCRMGCTFCASTGIGFGRNLTAGELTAQVALIGRHRAERISHVVLMGIGEPLENYEEVVKFIRTVNNPQGLNMSMRHITLSTCGLVDEIKKLAHENLPINLAISLHAPNDVLRSQLMPIAKRYPLAQLIPAASYYAKQTGRRITFEYALFADVNDRLQEAAELSKLLHGLLCHVNLIPANEFPGSLYHRSSKTSTKNFLDYLTAHGITATVRRELGSDIAAACGQLRRRRGGGE